MSKTNNKQTSNVGRNSVTSVPEIEKNFKLPTIDQFMELVTAEQIALAATPSGYNVYNKYHKSS